MKIPPPLKNINRLTALCKDVSVPRVALKYDNMIMEDNIILLLSGSASIRSADGVTLISFSAPMFFCQSNGGVFNGQVSLFFNERSIFIAMKYLDGADIIKKNNAWFDVSCVYNYVIQMLYQKIIISEKKTKYEVVKEYLGIIFEMQESERLKTSIFKYIMNRANISRSSLNKIIVALNHGGYIKTHRGKLINLHKLPERF